MNLEEEIEVLQDNLIAIMAILDWSDLILASKMEVTKQHVHNLKRKKSKLRKTQYIALRAIINYTAEYNVDETRKKMLESLFNEIYKDLDWNNWISRVF